MNLWVIDADKAARPARALKIGQYRSPLFSADGAHVFAVHGATIADIPLATPDQSRDLAWSYPGDAPRLLLRHGRDDREAIVLVSDEQ